MLSDTSYKTRSFLKKPTPFMGGSISQGELFILVEEVEEDGEKDVKICAEVGGVNVWDWLSKNNGNNVKIILEKNEKTN